MIRKWQGCLEAVRNVARRKKGKVPAFIIKGAHVDYHSIIGGPVTTPDCVVQCDPYPLGSPDGEMVVFVTKVNGCIS